ncbi:MAG: caspase family protein, partial [Rhizobacter sp.]
LADHSFSHGVMAKMSDDAVRAEATETEALLDATGRVQSTLFRFPYGARNEAKLTTVEALKLRSMMWSVDSMDWADPVPKSIADRVLAEVDKAQRGIILFHDIQGRTVQALPIVLDQLAADGYRFATWRDGKFVVSAPRRAAPDLGVAGAGDTLYRESHALVIGIDQYAKWPGLHHAVRDARAIQETLVARFGFKPANVTALFDGEATRANILRVLNDKLADAGRVKRDDRVMVYFAGHGSTRKLASGRDVGYIVPVDAGLNDLAADAISMPQLQEVAEALSAKHVLFMVDACYSGLGLTRGGAPQANRNFLADNARRI